MSAHDKCCELFNEMDNVVLDAIKKMYMYLENKSALLVHVNVDIDEYNNTGVLTFNANNNFVHKNDKESAAASSNSTPSQENVLDTNKEQEPNRLKENVLKQASQISNEQGPRMTRSSRSRQQTNQVHSNLSKTMVKLERLTEEFPTNATDKENLEVKQEIIEMPPPTKPPIKRNLKKKQPLSTVNNVEAKSESFDDEGRKTGAITKSSRLTKKDTNHARDSDVVIHSLSVVTIALSDSDDEGKEKTSIKPKSRARTKRKHKEDKTSNSDNSGEESKSKKVCPEVLPEPGRVTRTKTRLATKNKETSESETETTEKITTEDASSPPNNGRNARTKRKAAKKAPVNESSSTYEDALSEVAQPVLLNSEQEQVQKSNRDFNETVIIEKPSNPILNQTVVLTKPNNAEAAELNDLMTDDEDIVAKTPEDTKKTNKSKVVFSPYEMSPVKKRVEAFEKLGAVGNDCGTQHKKGEVLNHQQKSKLNTPTTSHNRYINYVSASAEKYQQTHIPSGIPKSHSALKAAQATYIERELRRKQKEAEALQKKEALIQAQTEERRRRREEKQLKAQQTRAALEKDKQKSLEVAERAKQEKMKQILAEKEERHLKQKEEAARKRAMALKKAIQEKEERRKAEEQQQKSQQGTPLYRKYKAPKLPTMDCHDSEDSDNEAKGNTTYNVAPWQNKVALKNMLRCMRYIDNQKYRLFCSRACTPDLRQIFPLIEPRKLKRTSSAIWNQSDMSKLEDIAEAS